MSDTPTPGPWAVYEEDCVFGADGFPIAACDGKADITRPHTECVANARLIARAVNCHADLLAAYNMLAAAIEKIEKAEATPNPP